MRITNAMMINNSLSNIATNKAQMNTLDTQLSTLKKIGRPSDDPIIAIRALRLRSSLSEVTQYLDKNIPDANSWLSITQGSLEETNNIVSDLYKYCNQGSTDTFATSERATIADSLTNLKGAFYSQGNVDYAGRYVFTGFKTDSALTFMTTEEASNKSYSITQNFTNNDISAKTVCTNTLDMAKLDDATAILSPSAASVNRITLGYSDVSGANFTAITYNNGASSIAVNPVTTTDPNYIPADGEVVLNTSTGELLLGKTAYNTLKSQTDISFTYDKTSFEKGDVKPEHYFTCVDKTNDVTADKSNPSAWTNYNKSSEGQNIEYSINFSQTIKVNTDADQAFNINLGRDIDELATSIQNVIDIESKQAKLVNAKSQQAYSDVASQARIASMIEAAGKEWDLANDNMQKTFESGITKMQKYQQQITTANSDVGNRISRLTLTTSRLKEQQTNFKDLKSKNEDVEIEDISVSYSSAQLVYNASLTAASKVVKQSLLDFL